MLGGLTTLLTLSVVHANLRCGSEANKKIHEPVKNGQSELCAHDAPYKKLVQALQASRDGLRAVRDTYRNVSQPGPYLTMVRHHAAMLDLLAEISHGNTTSIKNRCLQVVRDLTDNVDTTIAHALNVIPGSPPYTGENLAHDAIRAYGRSYYDVIQIANSTFHPTSKYQAVVRHRGDVVNGPDGHRAIIARHDNGPNCIAHLAEIFASTRNQRESLLDDGHDCSIASLPEPYSELPPHNCTITPIGCVGNWDLHQQ